METKTDDCQFDFIEDGEWFCAIHDIVVMQKQEPCFCPIKYEEMEDEYR